MRPNFCRDPGRGLDTYAGAGFDLAVRPMVIQLAVPCAGHNYSPALEVLCLEDGGAKRLVRLNHRV